MKRFDRVRPAESRTAANAGSKAAASGTIQFGGELVLTYHMRRYFVDANLSVFFSAPLSTAISSPQNGGLTSGGAHG